MKQRVEVLTIRADELRAGDSLGEGQTVVMVRVDKEWVNFLLGEVPSLIGEKVRATEMVRVARRTDDGRDG